MARSVLARRLVMVFRHAGDYQAARREIERFSGRVEGRLGDGVLAVDIDDDAADRLECSSAWIDDHTHPSALLVEAWRRCEGRVTEARAPTLAVGIVFVWPSDGSSRHQLFDLVVHVLCNVRRTMSASLIRLIVSRFELQHPAWMDAKREALRLLGHDDTTSYATALLHCDRDQRYDASAVYFFAPYRLRRSQATIIREERHTFVPPLAGGKGGEGMRRHVAMVRLASAETIAELVQ